MIVAYKPAQPFAAAHGALALLAGHSRKQQDVALSMVIPLGMEVFNLVAQHPPQGAFTEQDQLRQALLGRQIFVPRQQLVVHRPRHICKDARPIRNRPLPCPAHSNGITSRPQIIPGHLTNRYPTPSK